ncbi:hypothetical protein [Actinoplanes sp. L3-i22]|uniref:hypothetical protein n=1 Tax=Actinoplanes sp. L3-i22 TaxID=2836373 RepID=UPI001C758E31|nr:hypothetical protein [Actinoplanes sp. L3-i22]BCY07259.1 hypothetical protein L3i22_023470 [Actinoplanes sp. L3-i22]
MPESAISNDTNHRAAGPVGLAWPPDRSGEPAGGAEPARYTGRHRRRSGADTVEATPARA